MPNTTPPPGSNITPIVVRRRPGRPREVAPRPDVPPDVHDEAVYVKQLSELARESIETDSVVLGMMDPIGPVEGLDIVIEALGRESAGLLFDRLKLTAEGRDGVPQLCSRRIECLQKLSRLVIERELLRRQTGVMDDETVLKLVHMLTDTSVGVVHEVAPPAMAGDFEKRLREKVDGATWTMR